MEKMYPVRISTFATQNAINLFLIETEENRHYAIVH